MRNVFDAIHQPDQRVAVLRLARREANAAIADHRRGDAVETGRRQLAVPGHLPVIMRVDVDEARRDEQARRIDLFCAGLLYGADSGDVAVLEPDIRDEGRGAGSVDHRSVADDEMKTFTHATASSPADGREAS